MKTSVLFLVIIMLLVFGLIGMLFYGAEYLFNLSEYKEIEELEKELF